MISEQKLREEIERVRLDMATAPEASRDYQIGALGALLWAAGAADRGTTFLLAAAAWDAEREGRPQGKWLSDLLRESKAEHTDKS